MKSFEPSFDIDLVYLWVNGNDPVWRSKRDNFIGATRKESAVNCDGRYADNDELLYSLRSVAAYAPWIHHIFIITDSQVPEWLDTDNSKISIVDHKKILPPSALPTFNSVVIEHNMAEIPGLAEHFIYANDDMFFNRSVNPSDFFDANGLPYVRFNRRPCRKLTLWLKQKVLGKPLSNYNLTIQTAAMLVKKKYGRYFGHKTHHNIDAYTKSSFRHFRHEVFNNEIDPTLSNHVRADNDIQRNLYSYAAIAERLAHPLFVSQKTSFRFHIDKPQRYKKLEKYNPMLFCLNDSQYATDEHRRLVSEFLKKRFPYPSEFEKVK